MNNNNINEGVNKALLLIENRELFLGANLLGFMMLSNFQ